jgi:hypothetical protein
MWKKMNFLVRIVTDTRVQMANPKHAESVLLGPQFPVTVELPGTMKMNLGVYLPKLARFQSQCAGLGPVQIIEAGFTTMQVAIITIATVGTLSPLLGMAVKVAAIFGY